MPPSLFPGEEATTPTPKQGGINPPNEPAKKQASIQDAAPKLREMLHVSDVMLILGVSPQSARNTLSDIAGPRSTRRYRGVSTGVTLDMFCKYLGLDAATIRARMPRRPLSIKEAIAYLEKRD